MEKNLLHQDNMTAMKLEKNGNGSSSKQTKHIQIRHIFVKDKIEPGEITLKYCPTERMWVDVLTKPMQGKQFHEIRSMLMNCTIDYSEKGSRKEEVADVV